MMKVIVLEKDIRSSDAQTLLEELNTVLTEITGDDGTANFSTEDMENPGSAFFIAYVEHSPCGCGAIRRISENVAEVKRVYAGKKHCGVGKQIILALEEKAREFGYSKLILETRVQNVHAIEFYQRMGFAHCAAFGKYVGKSNAYCMEKTIK